MKMTYVVAALVASGGIAMAQNGNGSGNPRGTLVLDGGWIYDTVEQGGEPTFGSPWDFTLAAPAYFRISDDFALGDHFELSDATLGFLGETVLFGPRPPTRFGGEEGELAWQSGMYETLEILLQPGSYSLTIVGDAGGGAPADFHIMLENPVPTPGAGVLLAMGAIAGARRRRSA